MPVRRACDARAARRPRAPRRRHSHEARRQRRRPSPETHAPQSRRRRSTTRRVGRGQVGAAGRRARRSCEVVVAVAARPRRPAAVRRSCAATRVRVVEVRRAAGRSRCRGRRRTRRRPPASTGPSSSGTTTHHSDASSGSGVTTSPRPVPRAVPPTQRERHVAAELGGEARAGRRRRCRSVPQPVERDQGGGRVGAAAGHPAGDRDALGDVQVRRPVDAVVGGEQPAGAERDVAVVEGYAGEVDVVGRRPPPTTRRRRVTVTSSYRLTAW